MCGCPKLGRGSRFEEEEEEGEEEEEDEDKLPASERGR